MFKPEKVDFTFTPYCTFRFSYVHIIDQIWSLCRISRLIGWPLRPDSPGSSSAAWQSAPSLTHCNHSRLSTQRHRGSRPQTVRSAGQSGTPWCLRGTTPPERSGRTGGREAKKWVIVQQYWIYYLFKEVASALTMMFFSNISSPGVPLAWSSVWTTLSNLAFSSAGTEYLWDDRRDVSLTGRKLRLQLLLSISWFPLCPAHTYQMQSAPVCR